MGLGVVVLAGSSSDIVRIFFKLLMGTVFFGAFAGLVVLPVVLSLVGPGPCLAKDCDEWDASGCEPAELPGSGEASLGLGASSGDDTRTVLEP
jgi:Patched family